ncbi:MAG: hypothetical protein IBX56_19905 [Methylomicrobium sp.]|nr:hypothetical protein [Methylomicrobium sp.]
MAELKKHHSKEMEVMNIRGFENKSLMTCIGCVAVLYYRLFYCFAYIPLKGVNPLLLTAIRRPILGGTYA